MLDQPYFYHAGVKKAISLVGTVLNRIVIQRTREDGTEETYKVPLTYGPREKYLARTEGDPLLDKKAAIILPRIGFELVNWQYDGERKLNTLNTMIHSTVTEGVRTYERVWQPVPWDLEFDVEVWSEREEDGLKIVEQIIPFFSPAWSPSVYMMEDFEEATFDVPITLTGISRQDTYQPSLSEKRMVVYKFGLSVAWVFFGPRSDASVIQFVQVDFKANTAANTQTIETVKVYPGLTANGEPTTDPDLTIPYQDIQETDDWDYIVQIESVE